MRQHFGLRDIDSVLTWFGRKMKADSCSQLHREGWGLVAHKSSFRLKVKGVGGSCRPPLKPGHPVTEEQLGAKVTESL